MFWKKLINREGETQGEAVLKTASMQTIFMATMPRKLRCLFFRQRQICSPAQTR